MPPRPLTTTKRQRNIAWDTKAARLPPGQKQKETKLIFFLKKKGRGGRSVNVPKHPPLILVIERRMATEEDVGDHTGAPNEPRREGGRREGGKKNSTHT